MFLRNHAWNSLFFQRRPAPSCFTVVEFVFSSRACLINNHHLVWDVNIVAQAKVEMMHPPQQRHSQRPLVATFVPKLPPVG